MRPPPNRGTAAARPLPFVDGATRGPDGKPLSRFAAFAAWITHGQSDDAEPGVPPLPPGIVSIAAMADGSFVIASRDRAALVVEANGATRELQFREIEPPAEGEGA